MGKAKRKESTPGESAAPVKAAGKPAKHRSLSEKLDALNLGEILEVVKVIVAHIDAMEGHTPSPAPNDPAEEAQLSQ